MPLFKSSRKVQRFGTCLAVTIPATFAKVHELEKGSILKIFFGLDGVLVVSCDDDEEGLAKSLRKLLDGLD
jgi:antitoxin component of MazEF toxin-antitoxin module